MVAQQSGSAAISLKKSIMTHSTTHSNILTAKKTKPTTVGISIFAALLMLVSSLSPVALQASFTAIVNNRTILPHDTIQLTLRTDTDTSDAPDLKPLEWSFEVLGTRQSQNIRIINGHKESYRDWVVTLAPKHTGRIVIPSVTLNNEKTDPITINVRENNNSSSGSQNRPVFMRSYADIDSVYVQQELLFTLQIFQRVSLYDENRLTPLEIDNAIIHQLGDTQTYETIVDGSQYTVTELKYAIYPQKAGTIEIPTLTFTGVMAVSRDPFDSFFSRGGKPIVVRSPKLFIEVKPQPKNYPNQTWLPARNLNITDTWSQSLENFKVGDAITRTITIEADGLSSAQLPPVLMSQPDGVNSYPDQSSTTDIADQVTGSIKGQRKDSIAMIPTQPGTIKLPAVNITWFDTKSEEVRVANIPEKTITVQESKENHRQQSSNQLMTDSPADGTTESITCPESIHSEIICNESSCMFWQLLTALLTILWLITWILWWQKRTILTIQKPPSPKHNMNKILASTSEEKSFARMVAASKAGDTYAALERLKEWARIYLKDNNLVTLSQCLDGLGSDELKILCEELSRNLYSDCSNSVDLNILPDICRKLRSRKKTDTKNSELTALYPTGQ